MELISKFIYNNVSGIYVGNSVQQALMEAKITNLSVIYNGLPMLKSKDSFFSDNLDYYINIKGVITFNPIKCFYYEEAEVVVRLIVNPDYLSKGKEVEKEIAKEDSAINHPSHYNQGKFEVIDVIHDWKLGFDLGNAVKYIARAGYKDEAKYVEDLQKAIFYINDEIKRHVIKKA